MLVVSGVLRVAMIASAAYAMTKKADVDIGSVNAVRVQQQPCDNRNQSAAINL